MNLLKNIQQIAREVLLNEAEAIKKISELVDINFENCVNEILQLKGRVVVTGVGKSAIIANKIVATLNSTGTPALFMHAADAIHGDLGMVQSSDIVICISKSGNTPEVKVLVPLLKRTGAKLIAMVCNTQSFLAKNADFVLNATIDQEACPNNLAPTTSTTAHLALGDALAICLLECRGFTSSDFALYHPGGALGKQLYLKVEDIYPQNELPKVPENASVKDTILEISSKRLGAAAVENEDGLLTGVVTDGDLRRMMEKHDDISNLKARDIMSKLPKTIDASEYAVKALNMMQANNIAQLIVVREKKLVGFIHLHDILREGIV